MEAYTYVGNELDVFQHARRWKAYYGRGLRRYISGDVLEVGAGLGATSRSLNDGHQRSWTCLEPDEQLYRRLASSLAATPLASQGTALLGTVASIAKDRHFDTILYIDVLEHIENDRQELLDSAARLRSGGHIVVLAPAHQFLFSPFDAAIGHVRRYDKKSLLAAAPPMLELVRVYYLDAFGMLASLANRLVLRSSLPTLQQITFWDRVLVPVSRVVDPLIGYTVGKSVVAVWRRPDGLTTVSNDRASR